MIDATALFGAPSTPARAAGAPAGDFLAVLGGLLGDGGEDAAALLDDLAGGGRDAEVALRALLARAGGAGGAAVAPDGADLDGEDPAPGPGSDDPLGSAGGRGAAAGRGAGPYVVTELAALLSGRGLAGEALGGSAGAPLEDLGGADLTAALADAVAADLADAAAADVTDPAAADVADAAAAGAEAGAEALVAVADVHAALGGDDGTEPDPGDAEAEHGGLPGEAVAGGPGIGAAAGHPDGSGERPGGEDRSRPGARVAEAARGVAGGDAGPVDRAQPASVAAAAERAAGRFGRSLDARADLSAAGSEVSSRPEWARPAAEATGTDPAADAALRAQEAAGRSVGRSPGMPSAVQRILDALERLEHLPPPRHLTLELGDLRLRVGLDDAGVRLTLLGGDRTAGQELIREARELLAQHGFDLSRDGTGHDDEARGWLDGDSAGDGRSGLGGDAGDGRSTGRGRGVAGGVGDASLADALRAARRTGLRL